MDHYATLGVSSDVQEKELKDAYLRLVKQCHPDLRPNDKDAEDRFKRVSEAYSGACVHVSSRLP